MRQQIRISQIVEDIENGLTRNEIKEKYSLTGVDMKKLFAHPTLKGKKARKLTIEIIDDTIEETPIASNEPELPFGEPVEPTEEVRQEIANEPVENLVAETANNLRAEEENNSIFD